MNFIFLEIDIHSSILIMVTEQFANKPTHSQSTRRLDNLWTSQLADSKFFKIVFKVIIYTKRSFKHFSELTSPVQKLSSLRLV